MDGLPYLEIQSVKVAQQCSTKTGFLQITLILAKTITIWLQTEVWIQSTICRFLNYRIVYWRQIQKLIQDHGALQWFHNKIILMTAPHLSRTFTGKSFSEALILASVNLQYDKRLFIEFPRKIHTKIVFLFLFWNSKQYVQEWELLTQICLYTNKFINKNYHLCPWRDWKNFVRYKRAIVCWLVYTSEIWLKKDALIF